MGDLPVLSPRDVRGRRLRAHALTAPAGDPTPAGVVAAMHAAHAQVMSAAELSICLRLPGATRTTVREALWSDLSLSKTFGPRGTIHVVPTRDLPMWTSALSSVPANRSQFAPDVRLDPGQRTRVVAAVADALAEEELTIEELDTAVVERAGSWAGDLVMPAFQVMWPRWRQAISSAANAGALVFGAGRGRKTTYVSPRRADPSFTPAAPGSALPAFLQRYLAAFGPASPAHLARWMAAPPTWADKVFSSAGPAIEAVSLAGEGLWVNAGDAGSSGSSGPPERGTSVLLLPYFDALTVGFQPREQMFPGRAAERALARGQAGNFPVLVVDGVVEGVWHHRRAGRRVQVTVETWARLGPGRLRALEAQVQRVGEILEAEATELVLGPVSVGPHA